jgi:hypothetical protein
MRACFASGESALLKAGACDSGETAMKTWIGATALAALVAVGGTGTVDVASAAKIITVPQKVRAANAADLPSQRTYRYARYEDRRYDQPYYGGGWTYYYGRPYLYIPAPFPLGFDFGFGW